MLNIKQFRKLIIQPTLNELGMRSEAAEELLIGTAIQESRFTYLKQLGDGPALGLFQMEPETHHDIWENYIGYRDNLARQVTMITGSDGFDASDMVWNLKYAVVMARLHYRRVSEPLPLPGDVYSQGMYWKKYYNTNYGKGTVNEYVENWHDVMEYEGIE